MEYRLKPYYFESPEPNDSVIYKLSEEVFCPLPRQGTLLFGTVPLNHPISRCACALPHESWGVSCMPPANRGRTVRGVDHRVLNAPPRAGTDPSRCH